MVAGSLTRSRPVTLANHPSQTAQPPPPYERRALVLQTSRSAKEGSAWWGCRGKQTESEAPREPACLFVCLPAYWPASFRTHCSCAATRQLAQR